MTARLSLVGLLGTLVWLWIGGGGVPGTAGLVLSLGAGFLAHRSRVPLLREAAALPPALALAARLGAHAAHPAPPRLLLSLALLAIGALALAVALQPLAGRWRVLRPLVGLTLAAVVGCLLVAGLERLVRWRAPLDPYAFEPDPHSPEPRAYGPDPELGLALRPGFRGRFVHPEYGGESIAINADGFRGDDWPREVDPDDFGILMLGDSTLFGLGVEAAETIPARLEAELARAWPAARVHAYNAGVPGFGPRHALVVARRLLARLRPRVCVLVSYDGNDLEDGRRQFLATREAGLHAEVLPSEALLASGGFRPPDFLRESVETTPPLWTRHYWLRFSALFRDLDHRVADSIVALGWMPVGVATNNGFVRAMARTPDPGIVDELELAGRALGELAELCRAQGCAPVLVRLPGTAQAEPSSFRGMLERLGQDPALFDRARPGSELLARGREAGMLTLDLLPVLEVPEGRISPFYFREGHPNRRGNARIAEALARLLDARDPGRR